MSNRLRWVDMLRGLGVAAVFVIHATGAWVGTVPVAGYLNASCRWGIPLLFAIAGFVSVSQSHDDESLGVYARRRALRLGAPYLFWSGIAGIFLFVQLAPGCTGWLSRLAVGVLTGSSWYHLWFLGALFVCSVLAKLLGDRSTSRVSLCSAAGVLLLSVLAVSVIRATLPSAMLLHQPAISWIYGSAAYWMLAYLLGGRIRRGLSASKFAIGVMLCAGIMLLLIDGVALAQLKSLLWRGASEVVGGYLVAAALMLDFGERTHAKVFRPLEWLGIRSLGFYCVHPFALYVVTLVAKRLGMLGTMAAAFVFASAGILSIAVLVLLDRSPRLRFAVR